MSPRTKPLHQQPGRPRTLHQHDQSKLRATPPPESPGTLLCPAPARLTTPTRQTPITSKKHVILQIPAVGDVFFKNLFSMKPTAYVKSPQIASRRPANVNVRGQYSRRSSSQGSEAMKYWCYYANVVRYLEKVEALLAPITRGPAYLVWTDDEGPHMIAGPGIHWYRGDGPMPDLDSLEIPVSITAPIGAARVSKRLPTSALSTRTRRNTPRTVRKRSPAKARSARPTHQCRAATWRKPPATRIEPPACRVEPPARHNPEKSVKPAERPQKKANKRRTTFPKPAQTCSQKKQSRGRKSAVNPPNHPTNIKPKTTHSPPSKRPRLKRHNPRISNTSQISHVPLPSSQIVAAEVPQVTMPASPRQNLHQIHRGPEVILELLSRLLDDQASP